MDLLEDLKPSLLNFNCAMIYITLKLIILKIKFLNAFLSSIIDFLSF